MSDLDTLNLQQIRQRIEHFRGSVSFDIKPGWDTSEAGRAAVLIPLFRANRQWHVLFIRRAQHENDPHSGQVAFAGGKQEVEDRDMVSTALREAKEEIGLSPDHVDVLGQLPVHHSISRFQITPVVATIPWPCRLQADQHEVARIFSIPLHWLGNSQNYQMKTHQQASSAPFAVACYDRYDGEVLWGASARMTLTLISLLKHCE